MKAKTPPQIADFVKEILENKDCPSSQELDLYRNALLPRSAQHLIENHLLSCPVCALVTDIQEEFNTNVFEKGDHLFYSKHKPKSDQ